MPGFVLQVAPLPSELRPAELQEPVGQAASSAPTSPAPIRVGFTVSRKVGNAVVRNRVRRRLREAAQLEMPQQARPDLDYVLVGRQAALARDFIALRRELFEALRRLKALAVATP